jgi:hypothetical protein
MSIAYDAGPKSRARNDVARLTGGSISDKLQIMKKSRSRSEPDPIQDARVATRAVSTLSLARAMGLIDDDAAARGPVTYADLRAAAERVARAGIGRHAAAGLRAAENEPSSVVPALDRLEDAMRESPSPATEWGRLEAILGTDMLAGLACVSPASVRRYRGGERTTPDDVAARLHALALIVADLVGTYNDIGVRRWFERPRHRLGGRTPAALLAGDWDPHQPDPTRVRELARALVAFAAT